MKAVTLAGLVIYTLGAYAYGALAMIWLRDTLRRVAADPLRLPTGLLIGVSFAWFCGNATQGLFRFARLDPAWLDISLFCLAFAFPPIIVHLGWAERVKGGPPPAIAWRVVVAAMYGVAFALPASNLIANMVLLWWARIANVAATAGLSALFILAASCAIALGSRRDARMTARERQARGWMAGLFAVTIVLFVLLLALTLYLELSRLILPRLVEIAAKSLPLVFFFVASYYENRFEFFDLFVKRGVSLVAIISVLAAWFALVHPLLVLLGPGWATPLLDAILLLPVAAALPWLSARLGALLDRRWLGRRFSTVEAMTDFLARTASATTEEQLAADARGALEHVFGAPAAVVIGASRELPFAPVQEVDVRSGDVVVGRFIMGARIGEAPYFSEDVALLRSLAGVFARLTENLQLQAREQAQERRARELTLQASRSELKALRAQINPHFLFNALNSIAGLIHREPAVADRTIEQLADVFRYALRGAESEWALLDDELEFVRAYLEVERARFGARFQASVRLAADVRGARIPTMVVQTLVENAVKHGTGAVLGPAIVEVDARREPGRLVVSVTDNGPGFREGTAARGGGYGLVNVRQRLAGYFGDAGALRVERDADRGLTIVSVSLPLTRHHGGGDHDSLSAAADARAGGRS